MRACRALLDRGEFGLKAKIEDAGKSVAELARLATHLPKTLAEAEVAIARVSRMAEGGVDLSPPSIEGLAATRGARTRGVTRIDVAALVAAWLFGEAFAPSSFRGERAAHSAVMLSAVPVRHRADEARRHHQPDAGANQ